MPPRCQRSGEHGRSRDRLADVPLLGRAVSRDPNAYRYLVDSIDAFSSVAEFTALLHPAGFASVEQRSLWPGVAAVIVACLP